MFLFLIEKLFPNPSHRLLKMLMRKKIPNFGRNQFVNIHLLFTVNKKIPLKIWILFFSTSPLATTSSRPPFSRRVPRVATPFFVRAIFHHSMIFHGSRETYRVFLGSRLLKILSETVSIINRYLFARPRRRLRRFCWSLERFRSVKIRFAITGLSNVVCPDLTPELTHKSQRVRRFSLPATIFRDFSRYFLFHCRFKSNRASPTFSDFVDRKWSKIIAYVISGTGQ